MGTFVIQHSAAGLRFRLKARNRETIATSEVYRSMAACQNGVASVRRNAPIAALQDLTDEAAAPQRCPKFELYRDRAGAFRFRLKARNGQVIAVSGGYRNRVSCLRGIESVRKNAPDGQTVQEP